MGAVRTGQLNSFSWEHFIYLPHPLMSLERLYQQSEEGQGNSSVPVLDGLEAAR